MPCDTPNFQDSGIPVGVEDYKDDQQFISRKHKQVVEQPPPSTDDVVIGKADEVCNVII